MMRINEIKSKACLSKYAFLVCMWYHQLVKLKILRSILVRKEWTIYDG